MVNGQTTIDINSANHLASELANIGRAMLNLSQKIEKLTIKSKVKEVRVTPKTDPEMFTKEFIAAVKKARREIEEGKTVDYLEFRKTLDL